MKLAVFGASGATGRAVVQQALDTGHEVLAVVRRPDALRPAPRLRVAVVTDLRHQEAVDQAVAGQDAVLSALGTTEKGPVTVCTDGIRSILAAMEAKGVRRLVVVSAHGAADSRDRSLYSRAVWASLPHKMRDKEAMEALIRESTVDWTIVRPPKLSDRPPTGHYRTGVDLRIRITSAISRADLAGFMLHEAVTGDYLHRFPRIAA